MKVYFEYANIYKILFRKADWLANWLIKYRVINKTLHGVIISSLISLHCQIKTLLPVCLRVHSNNISTLAPAWWIEWLCSNLGSRLKLNRSFISSWCRLTLREWNAQVRAKMTTSGKVPKLTVTWKQIEWGRGKMTSPWKILFTMWFWFVCLLMCSLHTKQLYERVRAGLVKCGLLMSSKYQSSEMKCEFYDRLTSVHKICILYSAQKAKPSFRAINTLFSVCTSFHIVIQNLKISINSSWFPCLERSCTVDEHTL